jgi:hypothetical protein
MATEEERCTKATNFRRIDEAVHAGDLGALRAAVDDPSIVPNGRMLVGYFEPQCITILSPVTSTTSSQRKYLLSAISNIRRSSSESPYA